MSSTATIRAEAGKKGTPHPGGKDTTPDPPGQERKQEVIGGLPNMPDHARDKALVFTGPVLYYYISDHLGTPQMVVDAEGQVVWKGDYLPFGEVIVTADEVGNSIRFPGQYFDAETGLHYNWHRYYDPATGRYISTDPIGLAGGINLYAYVNGNPVNWVDPRGERPGAGSFWGSYPNYDSYSARDVWELVGGWLNDTYGPYSNTCATRVSYAMNGSADPIPYVKGASNKNDDGRRYIIFARLLKNYLESHWGAPDYQLPPMTVEELEKELECDGGIAVVVSNSHAGVVKKGYKDPYPGHFEHGGSAWILK